MGALTLLILAIGSLIIFQSHRQQKKIKWFTEKVDLTGKIAVVTGGSSGLGLSSAIQELISYNCFGSSLISRENNFSSVNFFTFFAE